MKEFLKQDFLLENETAIHLYESYAASMPIIDYHCHLDPKEIYEDKRFENITQLWLGGDHYKWRFMRACGIDEKYITGGASDKEKFLAYAGCLYKGIGNPLYHWSHMELKTYFGYDGTLNKDTAEDVWELCNKRLKEPDMSARSLIERSGVELLCTTDDPLDSLEWHEKLAKSDFKVKVLPAFRPDGVFSKDEKARKEYLSRLSELTGIDTFLADGIKKALKMRLDYFEAHGCKVADHGMESIPKEDEILEFLAAEYAKRGWVMQLHYGVIRNLNSKMYGRVGKDTGFDAMTNVSSAKDLAGFLDKVECAGGLPKTVIYSLNPEDNAYIDAIAGSFQSGPALGKIQHGAAWWLNDHKKGIEDHLKTYAAEGVLGNFIGMLTDSRSFISYPRHDYFRRILCNLIGTWVEAGEYPNDEKALAELIRGICYENVKKYLEV